MELARTATWLRTPAKFHHRLQGTLQQNPFVLLKIFLLRKSFDIEIVQAFSTVAGEAHNIEVRFYHDFLADMLLHTVLTDLSFVSACLRYGLALGNINLWGIAAANVTSRAAFHLATCN